MKRKADQQPITELLHLVLTKVGELRMNLGYSTKMTERELEYAAIAHLMKIIDAPEVTMGLGISMTALLLDSTWEQVDKPEPIVMRYAIEFAVEHRALIAEVILTGVPQGRSRVY